MTTQDDRGIEFALSFAAAWNRVERTLDAGLGAIRGISFAEYRILTALSEGPLSRVALAERVGLTPSGVTRALRPLEKIGVVTSTRSERDARKALATLTDAGRELLSDADGVVTDQMARLEERAPRLGWHRASLIEVLAELGRG